MTAIAKADIPDTCNTVERLAAWAILTLRRINPTERVIEVDDEAPQRVAVASILEDSTTNVRMLGRLSLPMNADFASSELALWELVEDISNTQIPPEYLNTV
jgi:hypothetical protein